MTETFYIIEIILYKEFCFSFLITLTQRYISTSRKHLNACIVFHFKMPKFTSSFLYIWSLHYIWSLKVLCSLLKNDVLNGIQHKAWFTIQIIFYGRFMEAALLGQRKCILFVLRLLVLLTRWLSRRLCQLSILLSAL